MADAWTGIDTMPRVQFGTRDDDSMPLSWAEKGLTWLKAERPMVFADMMTRAVFGIEKQRGRAAQ
jgi:hypothetical protein